MKKRKAHVEDVRDLTISTMDGFGGDSGTKLPADLIIETLSRLPPKSIARFRCVSKNWSRLLRNPDFTNLFLKKSSSRPRLLFTFQVEGRWSFFSLPQYLISDENSSLVVVDGHMDVPRDYSFRVCVPVCGLLCSRDEWELSGRRDTRMMIGNPSTGQFKSLPKVRSRRAQVVTFTGYDPIEKVFKVLCMTVSTKPFLFKAEEHQVLTLGAGNLKWRMIECSVVHYPQNSEICIDGVLYYLAMDHGTRKDIVVGFDVRYEKFSYINMNKAEEDLVFLSTLINYKGKLGGIHHNKLGGFMDGRVESFELWVIDNAEEHKWTRHIHILPPLHWKELVGETRVYIVGMIGTSDEIVFSPFVVSNPFYIFHLDMERNSIKRVEIKGIRPLDNAQNIHTFTNYVENVNLIM